MDVEERFERIHDASEYQYTLYYYDASGALVQTVPPAAVVPNDDPSFLSDVKEYREERAQCYNPVPGCTPTTSPAVPDHGLPTMYAYNSLGQVRWSKTPDKGESRIWYDKLGRPVMAQDARQQASTPLQKYSVTIYEDGLAGGPSGSATAQLGRVTDSYEMTCATPSSDGSLEESFLFAPMPAAVAKADLLHTDYDRVEGLPVPAGLSPQNLRNRVVRVTRSDVEGIVADQSTWYSYDEHGNVATLVQEIEALRSLGQAVKRMDYKYDLFSGNVHEAVYQKGKPDQWIHRYRYDANNRLKVAETSRDGRIWDRDVRQWYYLHGPMSRQELGTEQVQGLDYAGTILGWQKVLNSSSLVASRDMGQDGHSAGANQWVAQDVLGWEMGFFGGDYEPIQNYAAGDAPMAPVTGTTVLADIKNLYNGNIAWWVMNQGVDPSGSGLVNKPLLKRYRYDQLNRIREQQVWESPSAGSGTDLATTNAWTNATAVWTNGWKVTTTLDNNGNLLTLNRNANVVGGSAKMDELTYHYTYDAGSGLLLHNRLDHVEDAWTTTTTSDNDLETQAAGNYTYDDAGNLVQDVSEATSGITWDMFGKIRTVKRGTGGGTGVELVFRYGTDGNRYEKRSLPVGGDPLLEQERQYYVRDGSGNVMAIYRLTREERERNDLMEMWEVLKVSEFHIYGGERVGILRDEVELASRRVDGETGEPLEPMLLGALDVGTGARNLIMTEAMPRTGFVPDSVQGEEVHEGELVVLRNVAALPVELDGVKLLSNDQSQISNGEVSLAGELAAGHWLVVARGDSSLKDSLLNVLGLDTVDSDGLVEWQWHDDLPLPDSGGVLKLMLDVTGGPVGLDELRWGDAGVVVAEGEAILRDAYYEAGAAYEPTDWSVGGAMLRRLPITRPGGLDAGTGVPTRWGVHIRGLRMYELKDHLGNVHVVVSDRHIIIDADNDCLAEGFLADVLMSTDYYPYGSEMPGRVWNSPLYRYGFNGKEKDDEFNGTGNMYDYGFRVYDPRLGRFLSVDPLAPEYPELTPYQYASNCPILMIDLDGLEGTPPEDMGMYSSTAVSSTYVAPSLTKESLFRIAEKAGVTFYEFECTWAEGKDWSGNGQSGNTIYGHRTGPEYNKHTWKSATICANGYEYDGWVCGTGSGKWEILSDVNTVGGYMRRPAGGGDWIYYRANDWRDVLVEDIKEHEGILDISARICEESAFLLAGEGVGKLFVPARIGASASARAGSAGLIFKRKGITSGGGETSLLSALKPTHYITKSESVMKKFVSGVRADGGILESIKYVEDNGAKYIVDGHHRYFAAQKLGIGQVPVQQVQLPYKGYSTPADLFLSGKQPVWWKYFKP